MDVKLKNSSTSEGYTRTSKSSVRLSKSTDGKRAGAGKHSLSKTFLNIFHRRYSYTVKDGHRKKGKKLFHSINNADGLNVDYVSYRRSSKARVWSVRNSFSKSPVETVSCDLLKLPAKEIEKNKKDRTCSYAFDVLNTFTSSSIHNNDNYVTGEIPSGSVIPGSDNSMSTAQSSLLDKCELPGNLDETQDRLRLSSFGSSTGCSNISGSCSLSGCSNCNLDRSDLDSGSLENDLNTSYWDLRLPTENLSRNSSTAIHRRYSLSFASEHQNSTGFFGSPEIRSYLAKRRCSEQPARLSQNSNIISWQDKFLRAVGDETWKHKETEDNDMKTREEKVQDIKNSKMTIDIPRSRRGNQVRRCRSACGDMKRSQSVQRSYSRVEDDKVVERRSMQRSRSVDSRNNRRMFHSRERHRSRSNACQFAFSDIESSEESESSRDPKETSSEERQPSSNDSSSLSACSVSGPSNDEHNPTNEPKQEVSDTDLSNIEQSPGSELPDVNQGDVSFNEGNVVDVDNTKATSIASEPGAEFIRNTLEGEDRTVLEIPKEFEVSETLGKGNETNFDKLVDFEEVNLHKPTDAIDKGCVVEDDTNYLQGNSKSDKEKEDDHEKDLLNNDNEDEEQIGTDVDSVYQAHYEIEGLCLNLLFSEAEIEIGSVRTDESAIECLDSGIKNSEKVALDVDAEKTNVKGSDNGTETVNISGRIDNVKVDIKDKENAESLDVIEKDVDGRNYNNSQDDGSDVDGVYNIDHVLEIFDELVQEDHLECVGHKNQAEELEALSKSNNITKEASDGFIVKSSQEKVEDIDESGKGKGFEDNCEKNMCNSDGGYTEISKTDEAVQVENYEKDTLDQELSKDSLKDILTFSSGKSISDIDTVDSVDDVFEALTKEANKEENKDKDITVVFIVGGELKVIRRSGTLLNGSHGDLRQQDIPSMTRAEVPLQNGRQEYVHKRPVHDINRGRPKSAIIVTRSQSFHGMANQPGGMGGKREAVVLGESFRHHRAPPPMQVPRAAPGSRGAVGFSFKKSPKIPKVPRPNRALLMFQSVKRGVREFIDATKEDINQLQHRETDHTSTAQQIKSAERYLKRLEFHLAKLDELHEHYMLQQQLREGVRTMHKAYITSPGKQTHSLTNVKYGYKECTQTMCNIEAQLEAMMGTFNCKLKGMAGFARLCPGDVFEVTVRHGTQKWKTKGRIEKTGNQKWDIPEFTFKAVVGDIFNIKGLEVRAFKSVLLGQKSCETKDLFSANPQLMTVSINVNGSLKLSIVITWNPLDGVEESFNFMEAQPRAQGTPRRRPVSVIALNGQYEVQPGMDRPYSSAATLQQTKDDNFILRTNGSTARQGKNVTSYHGLDSPHVSARHSEHLPDAYRQTGPLYSQTSHHIQSGFHSSPALPIYRENDSDKMLPHPPTQNSAFSNSLPSVMGHLHFPSVAPHLVSSAKEEEENSVLNIEDVLHNLTSSLEDYHGQYGELQKLEDLVKFAHKLIRKQFRSSSRSSSISVSIESALEAFDFLDTEDTFEEPRSPTDNIKASFDDMLCSPESTAKTGDSGIESLAQRLSEDTQLGSSLGSSPVPPSTGNEEVDQCLMYHLTYCERLLENLGAFGPLKCREIYALDKLEKQCKIVESLLKLAKSGPHVDLHSVMSSICEDKTLREFWVKCTDQNSLYIHPDRLLNMLEQKYSSVIAEKHMMDPVKVCQHVITRVLDIPDYEAERGRSWFVLTLHQFMLYFNEEGGLKHIEAVAEEMKLVEKLTSGNPDIVIKAILTLRDTLPSSPCLKVIGMLLVTMDKEVEQCTLSYLNLIQKKKENRENALITFVEGLEDRTPEIRSGACSALAILEASESLDQLVYLWQSDSSSMVQKAAKQALLSLGDEGRKAFEDAQLSKHGFQGIQMHK